MGNSHPRPSTGKVILSDGSVREFGAGDAALTVAELMMEHPQQAVVELRSAVSGKRPPALAADTRLEPPKVYLMLPLRRGKQPTAALSPEEVRRAVLAATSVLRARARASPGAEGLVPLLVRMCRPAASAPVALTAAKRKKRETTSESTRFVSLEGFLEERPEYLSRQFSGKRGNWKPSLDTIEEKVNADQKKLSHWLF